MPDYVASNEKERKFEKGLNRTTSQIVQVPEQTTQKTADQIVATRTHRTYQIRQAQLNTNLMALKGGTPYIEARLSRFAGEDEISWAGGQRKLTGSYITGRKQQAHSIRHAGRIADKISQYVFGVAPTREGADPLVLKDISNDGTPIDFLMRTVNDYITACRWCWIGVDVPMSEGAVSMADKKLRKIRPYWHVYKPTEVVDWYIDKFGTLQWLITEIYQYEANSPTMEPVYRKMRYLWEPGKVTVYKFKPCDNNASVGKSGGELDGSPTIIPLWKSQDSAVLFDRVPFVLAGEISSEPHGFDDVESINRTIMDLESCNRQNFYEAVFPQRYFPRSALDAMTEGFKVDASEGVNMLNGLKYPCFISKDDMPPGVVMPDAASVRAPREEIKDLKAELFDVVGMMLRKETKQVESAEAKAFDHLDVIAVMRERASLLEDAESKAVLLSNEWDSTFQVWGPKYNKDFDVSNFKEEMETLVQVMNVPMPAEMLRFTLQKVFGAIKKHGTGKIDAEVEKQILDAIEKYNVVEDLDSNTKTEEFEA